MLDSYLVKSKLQLKKHVYDRTLSVLRSVENYEKVNLNKMLQGVLDEAVETV